MCDCRPESVVESNTVKENPRSRARLYLTKLSRDRAERVLSRSLSDLFRALSGLFQTIDLTVVEYDNGGNDEYVM